MLGDGYYTFGRASCVRLLSAGSLLTGKTRWFLCGVNLRMECLEWTLGELPSGDAFAQVWLLDVVERLTILDLRLLLPDGNQSLREAVLVDVKLVVKRRVGQPCDALGRIIMAHRLCLLCYIIT